MYDFALPLAVCGCKLLQHHFLFHYVRRGVYPQDCSLVRFQPSVGTGASAVVMASFLQTPYGEEAQTALLKTIDDDLSFLWNAGNKVPLDVQAKLADLGFTDIGVWAKVAETTAELPHDAHGRSWHEG